MRRILIVALVIAAAVLLWWLLRDGSPAALSTAPAAPTSAPEPAAPSRPPERSPRRAERPADEPAKEAAQSTAPERAPEKPTDAEVGGELLVVDAATGAPLAGVKVGFMTVVRDSSPETPEEPQDDDESVDSVLKDGRVFASDAHGKVRLPTFKGTAVVAARQGDLRGETFVDSDAPTWRLRLRKTVPVTAIVVDSEGRPCGGVKVQLVQGQAPHEFPLAEQTSDPKDGVARFADVDEWENEGKTVVTVALPLAERPSVVVDRKKPPTEPIRLVLPPTGRVRCEIVDDQGAPAPDGRLVLLRRREDVKHTFVEDGPGTFDDARESVVGGAAVFLHVGLGLELDVEAPSADATSASTSLRFAGPKTAGEETVVRLVMGGKRPSVVGRIVDAKGAPLAALALVAGIAEPGHPNENFLWQGVSCTTDANGRFRFAFDRPAGAAPAAKLQIGRGTEQIALLDLPSVLPAGDVDVGDVVYRGTALLVAGVVIDAQGKPLAGVSVCVMDGGRGVDRFPRRETEETKSDDEGRFRIEGDPSISKPVLIGASLAGYYAPQDAAFSAGTTDARVVMREAGGIAGSVRLPAGPSDRAGFHVLGIPADNGDVGYRFHDGGLRESIGADGQFEIRTLRPGRARVEIRLGLNKDDTIFAVDDVEVVAGKVTRDPRLADVDPTKSLRGLKVTVLDADKQPVTGAVAHFRPVGGDAFWKKAEPTDDDGTANVQAKADESGVGIDLIVICRGYRSAVVRAATADTTVVLERAKPSVVTVRLASASALPEPPFQLAGYLSWIERSAAGDDEVCDDPRGVVGDDKKFGKDRVLAFETYDAGSYRVALMLWKTGMGEASGSGIASTPKSPVVNVGGDGAPAEIIVGVDPEELKERTAETRK